MNSEVRSTRPSATMSLYLERTRQPEDRDLAGLVVHISESVPDRAQVLTQLTVTDKHTPTFSLALERVQPICICGTQRRAVTTTHRCTMHCCVYLDGVFAPV